MSLIKFVSLGRKVLTLLCSDAETLFFVLYLLVYKYIYKSADLFQTKPSKSEAHSVRLFASVVQADL